jgi:hypothetical protein
MNAKKTGKGMQTVKILVAAGATLFAVLSAGCGQPTPPPSVAPVWHSPAR